MFMSKTLEKPIEKVTHKEKDIFSLIKNDFLANIFVTGIIKTLYLDKCPDEWVLGGFGIFKIRFVYPAITFSGERKGNE